MSSNQGGCGVTPDCGGFGALVAPRCDQFPIAIDADARPAIEVAGRAKRHRDTIGLLMAKLQMIGDT